MDKWVNNKNIDLNSSNAFWDNPNIIDEQIM